MNNRILLVQQFLGDNKEVGPIFPIGLAYLATAISNSDWEVQVLDMNLCKDPYSELENIITQWQPKCVGISLRNIDNVDYDNYVYFYLEFKSLLHFIQKFNVIIIVGGAGFSIFSKDIMEDNPMISYGILLEGEESLVELLNCISLNKSAGRVKGIYVREGDSVTYTGDRKPIDFSKSPIPDRSLFDIPSYTKPLCFGVQSKRGCPLECSYCTYTFLDSRQTRLRIANDVVDEIEELILKYGIKEIIFCDDVFNVPQKHAIDIINEIIRRNISIRWSAWFDVVNTTEETIDLAIKSGCYRICFSIDAVNDEALKALHKNFQYSDVCRIIKLTCKKKYQHIDFRYSLFALPPGLTFKGLLRTIKIVYYTHVKLLNNKCLVSWIRILPHTGIASLCNNDKILLPKQISSKEALFYKSSTMPIWLINIYHCIIFTLNKCRKIKKAICHIV